MEVILKKNLTSEEVADFFTDFYSLRQADIAEKDALQIMIEGENNKTKLYFLTSLISAPNLLIGLEQFPTFIPKYITILLQQAQENNIEIKALEGITTHLSSLTATENGISYRQQLKSCLVYPAIILSIVSVLVSVMLIFIVPIFADLFRGFGAELPGLTQIFVDLSEYVQQYIGLLLTLALAVIIYLKSPYSIRYKSIILFKLPVISNTIRIMESTTIIKTVHLLCSYQFSLIEALRLSTTASQNTIVISTLLKSVDELAKGKEIISSLKSVPIFSIKTIHLLAVFERTHQLQILKNMAKSYHKQIPRQTALLLRLLNIILLILCWLIVGTTVIAMYLPIFKMGEAI